MLVDEHFEEFPDARLLGGIAVHFLDVAFHHGEFGGDVEALFLECVEYLTVVTGRIANSVVVVGARVEGEAACGVGGACAVVEYEGGVAVLEHCEDISGENVELHA